MQVTHKMQNSPIFSHLAGFLMQSSLRNAIEAHGHLQKKDHEIEVVAR